MKNNGGGGNTGYMQSGKKKKKKNESEFDPAILEGGVEDKFEYQEDEYEDDEEESSKDTSAAKEETKQNSLISAFLNIFRQPVKNIDDKDDKDSFEIIDD